MYKVVQMNLPRHKTKTEEAPLRHLSLPLYIACSSSRCVEHYSAMQTPVTSPSMAAWQGYSGALYFPECFITDSESSSQVSISLKARNARLGIEVSQPFSKYLEFSRDWKLKQKYLGTVNLIFVDNKGSPKLSLYLAYISNDFSPGMVLM
jgi:hypothetical protein